MKKRIISMLIVMVSIFAFAQTAWSVQGAIGLKFNGKNLPTEVPPVIVTGRTLVPVRVISEALGADVDWNSANETITITKNDKIITLKLNDKQVWQNNERLADLDVPAQILTGRTIVPIRFVSEALGAQVGWEAENRTVAVAFEEKRDGMTPEELMLKCNEVMLQKNSYKFKGTGEILITTAGQSPVKTTMLMDGMFKKTGNKNEVYVKQTVYAPLTGAAPSAIINIETYTDGTVIYQRMGNAPWQKLQLTGDITSMLQNQDPQKALQMMKDFSLITAHGNEAIVNDKPYYTLLVKIDGEKYKSFIKTILSQVSVDIPGVQVDKDEFQKLMDQLVSGMKLDLTQKTFVNKETFAADKTSLNGKVSLSAGGNAITEDITMDMEIYDLGEGDSMPNISLQ